MDISSAKGFTIIELLVVIAIIGVITAVTIFNHGDLSDQLQLRHSADVLSLKLREAQAFGLGVREADNPPGSLEDDQKFQVSYGVYLNVNTSNTAFVYFIDLPESGSFSGDDKYNFGSDPFDCSEDECISVVQVGSGNVIQGVEYTKDDGSSWLDVTNNDVSVTFARPDPFADIFVEGESGEIDELKITLVSPKDRTIDVSIAKEGKVSVE